MSIGLAPALIRYRPSEGSFAAYKREQSRIARRRLYPLTAFYTTYSLIMALLGLRSGHPWIGMVFYLAGVPVWSLVEYLFHRYVLHGRFPPGQGLIRRFLHQRLDPLHWEHHERPFDGWHISGELKDILPLFAVAAPLSFLFPVYTLPALLAGVVQSYVGEEWLHYFLHFRNVTQSPLSASQAISPVPSQPPRDEIGLWDHQRRLGSCIQYGVSKAGSQIALRKRPQHPHQEDDAVRGFKTLP